MFGEEQEVTEVGAMNLFVLMTSATSGRVELVTPPLTTGTVLPGVTRQSVLELARDIAGLEVEERKLTLPELLTASREGRLLEMFGSGTAAIISPVGGLRCGGELVSVPTPPLGLASQLLAQLQDIYYGRLRHPWAVDIEENSQDLALAHQEEKTLSSLSIL